MYKVWFTDCTLHASSIRTTNHGPTSLTNILASEVPPPVQVVSVSTAGIKRADGHVFSGPLMFLEGKVFLWMFRMETSSPALEWTRRSGPDAWNKGHRSIFETVVPRPVNCYLLYVCAQTLRGPCVRPGARMEFRVPPRIRSYTKELGIQLEMMDTVSPSR